MERGRSTVNTSEMEQAKELQVLSQIMDELLQTITVQFKEGRLDFVGQDRVKTVEMKCKYGQEYLQSLIVESPSNCTISSYALFSGLKDVGYYEELEIVNFSEDNEIIIRSCQGSHISLMGLRRSPFISFRPSKSSELVAVVYRTVEFSRFISDVRNENGQVTFVQTEDRIQLMDRDARGKEDEGILFDQFERVTLTLPVRVLKAMAVMSKISRSMRIRLDGVNKMSTFSYTTYSGGRIRFYVKGI